MYDNPYKIYGKTFGDIRKTVNFAIVTDNENDNNPLSETIKRKLMYSL